MAEVKARFRYWFIMIVIVCGLTSLTPAPVAAITEYCPAAIGGEHALGGAAGGPAMLWSYTVAARGPRTVVGSITIEANDGWYTFQFPKTVLTETDVRYSAPWGTITRPEFYSSVLYVAFPHPVEIQRSWVSSTVVSGAIGFPWASGQVIECQAEPGTQLRANGLWPFTRMTSGPDLTKMPGPNDVIVDAEPTSAPPGFTACAQPFQDARAVSLARLSFPAGLELNTSIEIVVAVAVSASGAVDDVWLEYPVGVPAFDNEALRVAKASTYQSGVSLCQHAPGIYYYLMDFNS